MIYVTGDVHGDIDINKFNTKNFPEQKFLTKTDYVIVCGDFGLVWDNSKQEKYWQNWLRDKKFTTLFVDGNHENFELLNQYPVEEWNGGKVHRISDSIIHLMRGQVFYIDGKKIFTFGGANSTDKEHRKEHISWWKEEMPSYAEMEEGFINLEKHNYNVDYIITHTCCSSTLYYLESPPRMFESDCLNNYLEEIKRRTQFKSWYFGHMHCNIKNVVEGHNLLYRKILPME